MFRLYSSSESVSESTTTLHLLFGSSTHSRAAAVCAAATLQLSNPPSRRSRQVRPVARISHAASSARTRRLTTMHLHAYTCTMHVHAYACTMHVHAYTCTMHVHAYTCTMHVHAYTCTMHVHANEPRTELRETTRNRSSVNHSRPLNHPQQTVRADGPTTPLHTSTSAGECTTTKSLAHHQTSRPPPNLPPTTKTLAIVRGERNVSPL